MNIFQLSNYSIVKLIPIDSLQLTLHRYIKITAKYIFFYDATTKILLTMLTRLFIKMNSLTDDIGYSIHIKIVLKSKVLKVFKLVDVASVKINF